MQRKLLTNGNAFKRTDDRWGGVVWYMDEHGERKRKSFSGTTKAEVNKKMTDYIADFENQAVESDESKKALQDSMQNWLQVFKFPSVEQTTYDRCECSAKNQIYPLLGDKPDCISFYKSKDCKKWEFCSRIMDFYECPDLFKLKVTNTDEELWVVYGANGKYHIGRFEDFTFTPIEIEGYIDYGDAVYAGQTFNNYESDTKRIYTAWLRDYEHTWTYKADEPNRKYGFSQAMALFTELSIHKTKKGYRLFRAPIAALETLRDIGKDIMLNEATKANAPYEAVFALRKDCDARIQVGAAWFTYDSKNHRIDSSSGKSYELCSDDDLSVRIIVDTRSAEIFLQSEITMSFSVKQAEIKADCGYLVDGKLYTLKSIWKK